MQHKPMSAQIFSEAAAKVLQSTIAHQKILIQFTNLMISKNALDFVGTNASWCCPENIDVVLQIQGSLKNSEALQNICF